MPPGLTDKPPLRQVCENLGSDPWLVDAVPTLYEEGCLDDLLLGYLEGYNPKKEQMTCAAVWLMYEVVNKLLGE